MDPATLVGIGLAFAAIFVSMIMEGGNPASIILPPPMILVFIGTFGVAMAGGLMKDTTAALAAVKNALMGKKHSADETVATLVSFAERARREGLLALEEMAKTVDDPFMRKGIELAVDGTDPDELREIMEAEIVSKKASDKAGAKLFNDMGGFAPTLGIIGTVLGLIHVLENLSEPEKLGHLIAGAFVATLWGVLTANVMWLPLGSKLKRLGEIEAHHMQLVMEGVLAVQAGANPRVIEQKLLSFLPAAERPESTEKAA
ncbi:MAG TPA: flagellar motor protein [Acidimicrobiia bacterium]|nr:flagellar motor protein [Acidimicrobiia bacterium]